MLSAVGMQMGEEVENLVPPMVSSVTGSQLSNWMLAPQVTLKAFLDRHSLFRTLAGLVQILQVVATVESGHLFVRDSA